MFTFSLLDKERQFLEEDLTRGLVFVPPQSPLFVFFVYVCTSVGPHHTLPNLNSLCVPHRSPDLSPGRGTVLSSCPARTQVPNPVTGHPAGTPPTGSWTSVLHLLPRSSSSNDTTVVRCSYCGPPRHDSPTQGPDTSLTPQYHGPSHTPTLLLHPFGRGPDPRPLTACGVVVKGRVLRFPGPFRCKIEPEEPAMFPFKRSS